MPDRLRPVEPDEWPRFGSVWTWGDDHPYIRLMALRRGMSRSEMAETVWFLDLMTGTVDTSWLWTDLTPASGAGWHCVDEGPVGMPRV